MTALPCLPVAPVMRTVLGGDVIVREDVGGIMELVDGSICTVRCGTMRYDAVRYLCK
jgi:hypothetical protein